MKSNSQAAEGGGKAGPRTSGPEGFSWAEVPRLGLLDLAAMLWAERAIVLMVGALVCALGLGVALLAPKTYTARAELLVRLGQEYVYQPNLGGVGAGATPDMQAVINAELRMIGSGAVARRAIEKLGLATLYPEIAGGGGSAARKLAAAERAFSQNFLAETAPQTPAIGLSFKHNNAEVAARALNALIEAYLAYRRDVLVGGESVSLSAQSADLDARAGAANAALSAFLLENGVADFDTEIAALAARASDIDAQALDSETRRREAEGRAAALRAQLAAAPEEIELYSESDARRQLVAMQVEREQLLSRYQPDAPPVREIDRRIGQLETFLAGGDPPSLTRRGLNPVRQEISTQLVTAEAEARAQRAREAAIVQQRASVRERLRVLQGLEPRFRQLLRERTILQTNAGAFASRAEEARAYSQMLGRSTDNISQVERARTPSQGQSLRLPIALITLALASLAALAAGLLRGLSRRAFPTAASAGRTLDAPVLGVIAFDKAKAGAKAAPEAETPRPRIVAARA
jgi:uncharacterized protein involved in exopolysaccharide biosynthesis